MIQLIVLVLIVSVIVLITKRKGTIKKVDTNLPYLDWDGLIIQRDWWPRYRKVGEQSFDVKSKDITGLLNSSVHLELWYHRHNPYDKWYTVNIGPRHEVEMVEYEDGPDRFEMLSRYKVAHQEGRLFVKWSKKKGPTELERKHTWNIALEVYEMTQPFPWGRVKEDPFYIHPLTRNAILKKVSTPEEIALMMENKFKTAENEKV